MTDHTIDEYRTSINSVHMGAERRAQLNDAVREARQRAEAEAANREVVETTHVAPRALNGGKQRARSGQVVALSRRRFVAGIAACAALVAVGGVVAVGAFNGNTAQVATADNGFTLQAYAEDIGAPLGHTNDLTENRLTSSIGGYGQQ